MQDGRFKLPRTLPLRGVLVEEMRNFKVKINTSTAHDIYEAWREGDHDDLVLAVALPLWTAETFLKPRARRRRVQEPESVPSYVQSSHARELSEVAPAGYVPLSGTPISPRV